MLPASKNSTSFWFPPDFSWLNVVVIPMPSANDIGKSWYRVHTLQNMSIFTSIVNIKPSNNSTKVYPDSKHPKPAPPSVHGSDLLLCPGIHLNGSDKGEVHLGSDRISIRIHPSNHQNVPQCTTKSMQCACWVWVPRTSRWENRPVGCPIWASDTETSVLTRAFQTHQRAISDTGLRQNYQHWQAGPVILSSWFWFTID